MTTLPKEILEEFDEHVANPGEDEEIWYWSAEHDYPKPQDIRELLAKVYTTARRQALTEGIEAMPKRQEHIIDVDLYEDTGGGEMCEVCGAMGSALDDECEVDVNTYRAEAIAKLTQLRDV